MAGSGNGPFWLTKMEENMPEFMRKLELRVLVQLTAGSCGCRAPSVHGLNSGERLIRFRQFTADMVKSYPKEVLPSLRKKMYCRAFRIGRLLSFLPGLGKWENKKRLIVVLYRNIGIGLRSGENGEKDVWNMIIPHCAFSSAYTPMICRVMSGMDAGIICGLLGGGKLKFRQRITEGCPYCSACYRE